MKKYFFFFLISVFLFYSCNGSPGSTGKSGRRAPEWTAKTPEDGEYYSGVGSSYVGNEEKDSQKSRIKALKEIVDKISLDLYNGKKKYFQSIDISSFNGEIEEVLKRNPDIVESYASYFSLRSGYWVYLRVSKKDWKRIEKKEIEILVNKSTKTANTIIGDFSKSIASRISVLVRIRNELVKSPYLFDSEISFSGRTGKIIDLFDDKIVELLNPLTIHVNPAVFYTEPGKEEKITVWVTAKDRSSIGSLPIAVLLQDRARPIAQFVTNRNGVCSDRIKFAGVSPGEISGRVEINLSAMNFYSNKTEKVSPFRTFGVRIYPISVSLKAVDRSGTGYPGLYSYAAGLFSGKHPFRISGRGRKYLIRFILISENIEEDIYTEGLYLTRTWAEIRLTKDGNEIFKYETAYYKDGGRNWSDSRRRGIKKLFAALNAGKEFVEKISRYVEME